MERPGESARREEEGQYFGALLLSTHSPMSLSSDRYFLGEGSVLRLACLLPSKRNHLQMTEKIMPLYAALSVTLALF